MHTCLIQSVVSENTHLWERFKNTALFADICSNQISPQVEHFNAGMKSDWKEPLQDVDPEVSWVLFLE